MTRQTILPFVPPKVSKRPVGLRCPRSHRHCWVLGAFLWCPDCGAVSTLAQADVGTAKWTRRWAYPGDNDAALDVQEKWPKPGGGTATEVAGTFLPTSPGVTDGRVRLTVPGACAVYDGFTGERLVEVAVPPEPVADPVKHNCWSCRHNLDGAYSMCRLITNPTDNGLMIRVDIWCDDVGIDETSGMPSKDADGCPGWKALDTGAAQE